MATPNVKKTAEDVMLAMKSPKLNEIECTAYRSIVMRAQYLQQDRSDLSEAVKGLSRNMKEPTQSDWLDLKRMGRYLKGKPRVVIKFKPQKYFKDITVYTDSDHAGCLKTRRSTSGTIVMLGNHCVKGSSAMQSTIALSSGESEYYGIVKAAAIGLQMRALLADWGYETAVRILTDSTAALGTCSRRGLGKLRHVQTRYLWVQ